uniref:RING-type domain-containing protein n=1 Tax=Acanthochromis polyacanthus TaxID=80966 RepID=A0A3Q1ECJ6_9TELE
MASRSEKDLCCPVCHDVFTDPVLLSCSHSFCRDCLKTWWRQHPTPGCPVCKRRSSREDPPSNLALKNLCESFQLQRSQRSSESLNEAAQEHRDELQETLKPLKEKLKVSEQVKVEFDQTAEHIKSYCYSFKEMFVAKLRLPMKLLKLLTTVLKLISQLFLNAKKIYWTD